MRAMKWVQCSCDICTNIEALLKGTRAHMCRHNHHVEDILFSAKDLVESTLCSMHKFNERCLDRKCKDCGTKHVNDSLDVWRKDGEGTLSV